MTATELRLNATAKVAGYTVEQCRFAIADCHDTLNVGGYAYEHPYAQKLWAEIDACRDRLAVLTRRPAR
jgi:hypothetical protein